MTTGPAFSTSPVTGHYDPRIVARNILGVAKSYCPFAPTDYSIAYAATLSGAAWETNSSGDKDGMEVEE